jgi:hypothetical protein
VRWKKKEKRRREGKENRVIGVEGRGRMRRG